MKGLKNKMAVGVRIVVILTVILFGTSIVASAQSLGEFGVIEARGGHFILSHDSQDIVSLTVTPRISGKLLLFAGAAILGMQMTDAHDASAAAVVQLDITQATNSEPPVPTGSGTVNALSIGATPTGAAFLGVPVAFMHVAHVTSYATYTFHLTAATLPPSAGFCTVDAGSLRAILLPAEAAMINVNCNTGSLQTAINGAKSGDIISVTGTCNENINIWETKERVTIVGLTTIDPLGNETKATIEGLNAAASTISIMGQGITVKGFIIKGGDNGIFVGRGGTATIDDNTIQNTGTNGIVVNMNSFARIINNKIRDNPSNGIHVSEDSSARIGFLSGNDTNASPNIIENNDENGILVTRTSNTRIVGNTIRNNTNNGVSVAKVSQADISGNTIDGNGENGILVTQNSGVNLGNDTGTTIFDLPNTTNFNNGDKGLRCSIGGYADGHLGTLKGVGKHDETDFTKGCIDSLIP